VNAKQVKRVLFCSGKVYYDLLKYQRENDRKDVAIIRFEQLYPFPLKQMEAAIGRFQTAEIYWVQEEPMNGGAWFFINNILSGRGVKRISRKASASPATGFLKVHLQEQADLVEKSFQL
jgi:2-oxoglutarate dehydrogenase E1 component